MDAFVFKFDAKRLRAIPTHYRGFLIASGHCCNELAILLPYIIFEHDLRRANEFEAAFILTRRFTVDRILISKIVEHGKLCSKFFQANQKSTDAMFVELSKTYEPIAAKIKAAKWAHILRNKASFHYDQRHAIQALDRLSDEHPLRLMAGRIKGLTLLEFAEEITSRPTFEAAGDGHIESGMDVAHRFITELVGMITTFNAQATISMFKAYGMISERVQMKLRKRYCAAPGAVRVPLSVSEAFVRAGPTRRTKRRKATKSLGRRSNTSAKR